MSVKKDIRFRVYLSFTIMLAFALAIIVKVLVIQFRDGDQLRAKAEKVSLGTDTLRAERGNIYSEDGTLLCSTIPEFDLYVDFGVINKDSFYHYVDSLSQGLSKVLKEGTAVDYKRKLTRGYQKGLRFWPLKRKAPYYVYEAVKKLPLFEKRTAIGGLILEPHSKRINPYGFLAYRTIGLWRENAPSVGLEREYDDVLSGHDGFQAVRKVRKVRIPIKGSEVEPENGKDIVTTIDVDIQDITENALLNVLEKYECEYGTAIVMEVKTGKIRALANLGRNPKDGNYYEDFNHALVPTEPGSTFKLFSLLSLIDDGYVTLDDKVNVGNGTARFGRQTVRDDHAGMGIITVREALAHSSNVAFAKMVDKYYHNNPMKFIHHLQKLHLNVRTGIDIPGERSPRIKTTKDKDWNKVTTLPWIGYGYESMVSPLQTCMVYNAVANGGKMMKPYLVSAIREYGQDLKQIDPVVLNPQIAKPSTIKALKEALLSVVETGTGRAIKSPYFNFGGKTGTAQVADKGISYADGVRQGSFVGFFPIENPQYTICVVARSKPHGVYYGAALGAPVFQAIANRLYATKIGGWKLPDTLAGSHPEQNNIALNETINPIARAFNWGVNLPMDKQELVHLAISSDGKAKGTAKEIKFGIIPDVQGLGLKDALAILQEEGLKVKISGMGKVKSQSLPAGSKTKKGQTIHLVLG